ncbi:bifunctional adenosylcobinamide kinase/adenosylcobinamide-phosphate guanylyltransferase [Neobacillus sedimentimangrovi]|uniref:bifunctional adenosylcobinamide kinase/adenosylcobinamide-phosphate guanylyltransferase n=1 Tax=Neobacillus sedimentimangrovi TaxID=2699460 RepID=UPI0013D3DC00|nr:bifunctional adenosylcobinamide kinase/adenosylcobinamide-phosphate guanylyltransferase [Neobacillus sedimentimangrovi]
MAASSSLIFITGGVRSGKSSFAERLATEFADKTGGKLTYIATGVPSDREMKLRIKKHQRDRLAKGSIWRTLEQPVNIGDLASKISENDIILLDCVTTLLNNQLFVANRNLDESDLAAVKERIQTGIIELRNRAKTVIVVSNEVLHEPIFHDHFILMYGKLLGQIHQFLVNLADQAYLVEAGIPIIMKGMRQ